MMLEQLYEKNKEYFHALNIYIAAGVKVEELRTTTIPELKKGRSLRGPNGYQDVNDMIQFADRLEKRLYDLKLSRQITIQSAPQIRHDPKYKPSISGKNSNVDYDSHSTLEKPNCHCVNTYSPASSRRSPKTSFKNDE